MRFLYIHHSRITAKSEKENIPMKKILLCIILMSLVSINELYPQITIENFSPESLPTGFHAITAENGTIIVTFPEEGAAWKSHCYNTKGKLLWEYELQIKENEYVIQDELFEGVLNIFSTIKDEDSKEAVLYLRRIDEKTGKLLSQKEIWKKKIHNEEFNDNKADVIADENMAVIARRDETVEVHLEYRFNMHISLRESKYLFYIYDYSKPQLKLDYIVFDQNVQEVDSGHIDFEDGMFIYEIKVNDMGDVFVVNSNIQGDLEVYKYPVLGGDYEFLNIRADSLKMGDLKDDLTLKFIEDNKAFLAAKLEYAEFFLGAFYALFDFDKTRIEREHFQPLNIELLHKVDSLHKSKEIRHVVWNKYNLTHFKIFNKKEVFLVFEHMDITHSGHIFREIDFVSRLPWKKHNSKVSVGPTLIFAFDDYDVLKWSKYFNIELQTDESLFPLSSAMNILPPEDDLVTFIVRENDASYSYKVEYKADVAEEKEVIEEIGGIIPAWTVKMKSKYYASYYSHDEKTLVIKAIDY